MLANQFSFLAKLPVIWSSQWNNKHADIINFSSFALFYLRTVYYMKKNSIHGADESAWKIVLYKEGLRAKHDKSNLFIFTPNHNETFA